MITNKPNSLLKNNVSHDKRGKFITFIFENDLEYDDVDFEQSMIEFDSIGIIGFFLFVFIATTFIVLLFFFYNVMSMIFCY
jgi:hypothetical protein